MYVRGPIVLAGLLFLAPTAAVAGDEEEEELAPEAAKAEYVRLSQELEKLASRNAWAGVERTYNALVETQMPPTFADHIAGAHAARALGNIAGSRTRLMAANEIREEREVLDWLWDIDANYGKVFLACGGGKEQVDLAIATMPFDPGQQRAVQFAMTQIGEQCLFDGYLPKGDYTFGPSGVAVVPRVQSVRIDLRGIDLPKKKKEKKDKNAEG